MNQCTCLKMPWNSKTAGCRVRQFEVWKPGDTCSTYGVALTLKSFWVIQRTYLVEVLVTVVVNQQNAKYQGPLV